MVMVWKAIKPGRLKEKNMRLELLNQMRKAGRGMRKDFNRTTRTWKGEKPKFEFLISLTSPGPTVVIEPGGSVEGIKKWRWLDEGTAVRYATMTPDFKAKTMPGVIDSRSGRGGLWFVNKNRPRPGIKARRWSKILAKQWEKKFKRLMEEGMRNAARKSGHAI